MHGSPQWMAVLVVSLLDVQPKARKDVGLGFRV